MASPRADDRASPRHRFSLRARTLAGLGVLLAILLVTATALVVDSWLALRNAAGAEQRSVLAGELARAAHDIAFERGLIQIALMLPGTPSRALVGHIEDHRAGSRAAFETAFGRLAGDPGLLSASSAADLRAAADRVGELRPMVDAALAVARDARDPETVATWRPALAALLENLRQAIAELNSSAAFGDAALHAALDARMVAFDLRNAAGERTALVAGVLASRRAPDLADAVLIGARSEIAAVQWRRLQRLSPMIDDPRLTDSLDAVARTYFDGFAPLQDRVVAAALAGDPLPVTLEAYGQASRAPMRSLGDLVALTQSIAIERLHRSARRMEFRLYASGAAALTGLAVAGLLAFAFHRNVLRPIERITDAMRRLVGGTAAPGDLPSAQNDEIGEMARSIAAFRDSIVANEAALSEAERFTHETIDALPAHIAVLDESGAIVATNKSWRRFARENDGSSGAYEGQSYLAVCDRAAEAGDRAAQEIAAGIRSVMDATSDEFEIEYPCHALSRRRWFRMRVTRFAMPAPLRIVVAHDDITARKLAEEGVQEKNRLLELAEEMSRTGHWRMDVDTGALHWSSEIYRIYGWPPQDPLPDLRATLVAYHPEDRELFTRVARESIASGTGFSLDLRLFRSDGQLRNVEVLAECEKAEDGRVVALFGVFRDITDRKKNEERLADLNLELERRVTEQTAQLSAREAYLRGILDNVAEIVITTDELGRIESFNPAAERAFGYPVAEVLGRDVDMLIDDPQPDGGRGYIRRLLDTGDFRRGGGWEVAAVRPDGSRLPVEITIAEMKLRGGLRFIATMRDITERKRAERSLLERAALLRRAQDLARAGHWTWLEERQTGDWHTGLEYSPEAAAILGVAPEDLVIDEAKYVARFVYSEDRAFVAAAFRDYDPRRRESLEYRIVRPDGSLRHIRELTEDVPAGADEPTEILGMIQDVTERKQAERALRDSEARLRAIFDHAPVTISLRDVDGRYIMVNRRFQEIFGLEQEAIIGKWPQQFYPPRFLGDITAAIDRVRQTKSTVISEEGAATIHGDRRYLTTRFPIMDDTGWMVGIGSISIDVTEQRAAEAALRESEARLRAIYESEPECVALVSSAACLLEINPAGMAMVEASDPQAIIGRRLDSMMAPVHRDAFRELVARVFEGGSGSLAFELTGLAGARRWMEMNAVPLRDRDGTITAMLMIARDVTAQRHIEEQLRQAQKMEAIGQLTGGLAHDFNNLLGVIVGNLDLLAMKLARMTKERELIERAIGAAERGAALTNRLLAFARRQTLLPQRVDAGKLVIELAQLLRRSLGERIELKIVTDPELMPCYVDPGQLETALLNLAINARDAMPEGGVMTISAGNAVVGEGDPVDASGGGTPPRPGKYVVISVTDTGVGMDESVRARAFEPFFTTKEVGRGSGLGLSMVYGFVEQSGGQVRLASEIGRGTTVTLYLEAAEGASPGEPLPVPSRAAQGEGELVLVVEDDDEMRSFARDALHGLGYRTIPAVDGADALAALRENRDVAVLFTDVVLPGALDGFALAGEARVLRPDLPVLYTSGFADAERLPSDLAAAEIALLRKPYRVAELGHRLERLLKREKV